MAETAASYKRHGEHQMIDYAQRMRKRAENCEAALMLAQMGADEASNILPGLTDDQKTAVEQACSMILKAADGDDDDQGADA